MKVFYKRVSYFAGLLFVSVSLYAQNITPGTKLFMQNEPEKAIPVLLSEIKSNNAPSELYNYLGLCYYQTGKFSQAAEVFDKGLDVLGTDKKILYYNKGNACYRLSDYEEAVNCYSMAVAADSTYAEPYLNRANAYLRLNDIDNCISDYEKYLELKPLDVQEPKIRELLSLLEKEKELRIQEAKRRKEEQERLKQEEERLMAAKAEQQRIAEEKKAQEAERRRKLLEEVANSLKKTSDTTNMSAGAESVLTYDDESEID